MFALNLLKGVGGATTAAASSVASAVVHKPKPNPFTNPIEWLLYDIKKTMCNIICCGCCTESGKVIISALVDTRGNKIKEYNAGVDLWTKTARDEFVPVSFEGRAQIHHVGGAQNYFAMTSSTDADPLSDDDTKIKKYMALKWVSGSSIRPWHFAQYTNGLTKDLYFKVSSNASSVPVVYYDVVARNVRVFMNTMQDASYFSPCSTPSNPTDDVNCSVKCEDSGGIWGNNQCTFHNVISKICVKFSKIGSQWSTDAKYGGIGCVPGTDSSWNPAEAYSPLSRDAIDVDPMLTVTSRSAKDPYVLAAYLTDGTFNFGLTQAQTAMLGLIVIAIGGLILCCMIFPVVVIVKFMNKRKNKGTPLLSA